MHPTLLSFDSLGLHFHSYTVMFAVAFLVGTVLPALQNFKRAEPFPVTTMGGIWVFLGALIGSKVYWWIQYGEWADLKWGLFLWNGGLVFYGGLFGGVLGGIAYARWCRAPIIPLADLVIPYVALAHAFGRVGCFLNGCCWGSVTHVPWAVSYRRTAWNAVAQQREAGLLPKNALYSLPVHPTQLYEAAGCVVIFLLLRFFYRRNTETTGLTVSLYLLLYGMLRFTTECFRGDSYRPLLGLTMSQLVAVVFMVTGFGALCWLRARKRATTVLSDVGKAVDQ